MQAQVTSQHGACGVQVVCKWCAGCTKKQITSSGASTGRGIGYNGLGWYSWYVHSVLLLSWAIGAEQWELASHPHLALNNCIFMGTGSSHQGKGMCMCIWKNVKVNIVLKSCTVAIEISHLARNNCTFTVQDIARALVGVRKGWYVKFAHLYSFELCYARRRIWNCIQPSFGSEQFQSALAHGK